MVSSESDAALGVSVVGTPANADVSFQSDMGGVQERLPLGG